MCVFSPVIIGYIYILHTLTIYIHIYVYIVYIYSYILIIKQLSVNKAVNGICKRNFTVYKFPHVGAFSFFAFRWFSVYITRICLQVFFLEAVYAFKAPLYSVQPFRVPGAAYFFPVG